jgi:hypothetical protein
MVKVTKYGQKVRKQFRRGDVESSMGEREMVRRGQALVALAKKDVTAGRCDRARTRLDRAQRLFYRAEM